MTTPMRLVRTFMPQGRKHRHSWVTHVGIVDHVYGPLNEFAYVKTLCGRKGKMFAKGTDLLLECKTCLAALKEDTLANRNTSMQRK